MGTSDDDDEPEMIPTPTLIAALSTLQSHLSQLAPSLDARTCIPIYRNISMDLSTQIVDKIIMAGGSKRFNAVGARRFADDVARGWLNVVAEVAASTTAGDLGGLGRRPEAPWRYLRGVATILSAPEQASAEDDPARQKWTLSKTVRAAFHFNEMDDRDGWAAVSADLGLPDQLNVRVAREVLRRRTDCVE